MGPNKDVGTTPAGLASLLHIAVRKGHVTCVRVASSCHLKTLRRFESSKKDTVGKKIYIQKKNRPIKKYIPKSEKAKQMQEMHEVFLSLEVSIYFPC